MILGDCFDVLPTFDSESFDAVITDPPYSSGGMFRSDRGKSILEKYGDPRTSNTMDFTGDSMDAHSWNLFTRLWMREAYRVLRPAGYVLVFTDWRQLPGLTDIFQVAGFTWRGIVPWDKGGAAKLPHLGYFRHQCEYVVWGTRGALPADHTEGKKALPGVVRASSLIRDRQHPTEKPVDGMLSELIRCVPEGARILDPFAGVGSTGIACARAGRKFVGIEIGREFFEKAQARDAEESPLYRGGEP